MVKSMCHLSRMSRVRILSQWFFFSSRSFSPLAEWLLWLNESFHDEISLLVSFYLILFQTRANSLWQHSKGNFLLLLLQNDFLRCRKSLYLVAVVDVAAAAAAVVVVAAAVVVVVASNLRSPFPSSSISRLRVIG